MCLSAAVALTMATAFAAQAAIFAAQAGTTFEVEGGVSGSTVLTDSFVFNGTR